MAETSRTQRQWPVCRITTLIPICLVSTIIVAYWVIMSESLRFTTPITTPASPPHPPPSPSPTHLIYTAIPDYFLQSLASTDPSTFNITTSNFGLIPQSYDTDTDFPPASTQWQRFTHKLMTLNANSQRTTSYRLLFLGRHGQGYHNVAEAFFGTDLWDCFYSTLNGSKDVSWADAKLTPLGVAQAEQAKVFWERQVREMGMEFPESFYVSPLERAARTAEITFRDLDVGNGGERQRQGRFKPMVKEGLREGIGIHTCDRRSTRSYISETFPGFEIEEDFAEDDPLWQPDLREPGTAQTVRLRDLLDDVFTHDSSMTISMTSHGGTIQSILRAVGHREFTVPTGGIIPVLVKVEVVQGERGVKKEIPWQTKPGCEAVEPGENEVEDALRRFDESVGGTKT